MKLVIVIVICLLLSPVLSGSIWEHYTEGWQVPRGVITWVQGSMLPVYK